MLKKAHYIAFAVVALVTLVVLNLPSRTAAQLKLAISGLFLPLFGLSHSTQHLAQQVGDAIVPREDLLKELHHSKQENEELRIHLMRLNEAVHENQRLHRLLKLPEEKPWKLQLARVISRDPANWWRTIQINVGLRDGISTNSPVLIPEGLVGRISEPGFSQSRVVLLGDPDCRVAVMVNGPSRDHGVIAPASSNPLDPSIVDLDYLSQHSDLKPGQQVLTSGLGGIFPKGIPVGRIIDFQSVDFGLYSEARVKLSVRMNELEEVWVILP